MRTAWRNVVEQGEGKIAVFCCVTPCDLVSHYISSHPRRQPLYSHCHDNL